MVDGSWEDALRCSVESLVARLIGKTLLHESILKGTDKYKICKYAPAMNPTRVTLSEKAKGKHKKMIKKAWQKTAADKKIESTDEKQHLVKQTK